MELVEYLEKLLTFMDEIITSQTVTPESFSSADMGK